MIIEVFNPTSIYTGAVPGDGEQAQQVVRKNPGTEKPKVSIMVTHLITWGWNSD